jgi:NAD(P)-dependent dehydrogenase (short-subunit alcohol dehydrogenase family)
MGILEGKVAAVTGAGRGLGRSEAMRLAAEGARVVVNDLGSANDGSDTAERPADEVVAEIVAAGGEAVANFDDISSWQGGQGLIDQAIDTYGKLDILICNAGIIRDRMLFNMSENDWDAVMRVHMKGSFVPSRFAAEYWRTESKKRGPVGGRLIYTTSALAFTGNEGQINYSAAKAGIAVMGLTAARELAGYGVTVNSISPGGRTRLSAATFPDFALEPEDGSFWELDPDHIGPWVAYLCSDAAADISGQTFVVYGGLIEVWDGWRVVSQVDKHDRWTIAELDEARAQLFKEHSSIPRPRHERMQVVPRDK